MKDALELAVKSLADDARKTGISIEAQQYTQAALNAVHALSILEEMKEHKERPQGT